jgi:hypothetical protein
MELILDKSFLDAASPYEISDVWKDHIVIMPDVLFYELISTREDSRKRCFNKIPDVENPLALLPGIGDLLSYEIKMKQPCVPLSQRCMKERYVFNVRLRDGSFRFLGEVLEGKETLAAKTATDTRHFIKRCIVVHQFFPEINGIPYRDFPKAICSAKTKVASDKTFLREIYASFLKDEDCPLALPNPSDIDENWAFFRWVQCQLLAALRLFLRYQGRIPKDPGVGFWTKAEHSMLDTYYVIFGSLTGALASADREVIEDFRLLCPDGALISPAGHP